MATANTWKRRGFEVRIPSAQFIEEFEKATLSKPEGPHDLGSVVSGLRSVHFNIEEWPNNIIRDVDRNIPNKSSFSISIDEADELANWLIDQIKSLRRQFRGRKK